MVWPAAAAIPFEMLQATAVAPPSAARRNEHSQVTAAGRHSSRHTAHGTRHTAHGTRHTANALSTATRTALVPAAVLPYGEKPASRRIIYSKGEEEPRPQVSAW